MTVPQIGGVDVPATMANRGKYQFMPAPERLNGAGQVYRAGVQEIRWGFPYMTQTEWDWWIGWLVGGVPSATLSFLLWDDSNVLTAFATGELLRPKYSSFSRGLYQDVEIRITHLLPVVA